MIGGPAPPFEKKTSIRRFLNPTDKKSEIESLKSELKARKREDYVRQEQGFV